jgi:hypothetical protein
MGLALKKCPTSHNGELAHVLLFTSPNYIGNAATQKFLLIPIYTAPPHARIYAALCQRGTRSCEMIRSSPFICVSGSFSLQSKIGAGCSRESLRAVMQSKRC